MTRALRVVAAIVGLLGWAFPSPGQDVVEPGMGESLDRAIRAETYGQFWGSAMVVYEGRLVLAKGYGLANRELRPITADSLLELASVSKAFTAAAVLRLEMRGVLSTADPISKHLDGVPPDKAGVTIHHLVTHTSGIGQPTTMFEKDEREAAVRVLLAAPVETQPGTAHAYSNAGYWLLAAIIERATGKTFEDVVREEVLRPAGMLASACQTDPALALDRCVDRVIRGKASGSAGVCPYTYVWGYRGSGGIVTSARDMFAWDRALRGDTFLSAEAKAKMHAPALNAYAYGWEVRTGVMGREASHTGGVAGFAVAFTRYLDADAAILVMTNEPHNPVMLSRALTRVLFPGSVESVSATLRPSVHGADEHGMSVIPGNATYTASPSKGGGVEVRFAAPGHDPALVLRLSKPTALRVAGELNDAAKHAAAAQMTPNPPVRVEVYTGVYKGRAEPIEVEGPEVALAVQSGTPHPEPGGHARVTIIVQDPVSKFWPVFVKLASTEAEGLASAMLKALSP